MSSVAWRSYAARLSPISFAAVIMSSPALAAPPAIVDVPTTITVPETNVLNLLSPFLRLDPNGATLQANLQQAISINNSASIALESMAISDKYLPGNVPLSPAFNTVTPVVGPSFVLGIADNLAGGLPLQVAQSPGGVQPYQPVGGYGVALGAAYQAGARSSTATTGPLANTVSLLNSAYTFTGADLGVAKNYFANGGANNSFNSATNTITRGVAVAPPGYSLPSANGLPNTSNSVYDLAYGVQNTGPNQDIFGSSRPTQVSTQINNFDPTSLNGIATNPSFPSGHTTYAFTDSILLGLLVPERYQSMLLRASEYANSRIVLGVHYPLDIIASRAMVTEELSQLLSQTSPAYTQTNSATAPQPLNLPALFAAAQPELRNYLVSQTNTQNGTSFSTISGIVNSSLTTANDPYANTPANQQTYQQRLTYGLPTLSFDQAPRELAPIEASSLLSTVYGGKITAAGVTYGTDASAPIRLSAATIQQILTNTETNELAAFSGTALGLWARLDLYSAAGYLNNIHTGFTGSLLLAWGDQITGPVTIGSGGIFGGSGTVNGNVTFLNKGALGAKGDGSTPYMPLSVNGNVDFKSGSKVDLTGVFLPGTTYTLITSTGPISIDGVKPATSNATIDPAKVAVDTSASGNLMSLFSGSLAVVGDPQLQVQLTSHFVNAAQTSNQASVASALDKAANAGNFSANGVTLLDNLIANNTAATAPAAYNALSGEGLAGQQDTALRAGDLFSDAVLGAAVRSSDFVRGRHVWAQGFGEFASLDGEPSTGSADLKSNTAGVAGGADFQVSKGLVVGLAAGFSTSNFDVNDRATSGGVDGGHVGVYAMQRLGDFYVSGVANYGRYDNDTKRTVSGVGPTEEERAKFSSDEWGGRAEAGYRTQMNGIAFTPFAGFLFASLSNDAFSETGVGGAGMLGLHVNGQTIDTEKSFLGMQIDTKIAIGSSSTLVPYARVAWQHEFSTDRQNTASLLSLPSNFTVDGVSALEDAARVTAGFKLALSPDVSVSASFDGEYSGRGNSQGGRGEVSIRW